MNKITQSILASIPLLITPVLFYALAEGILNLGGGEKDILWVFPWLIWSLLFAVCTWILIIKGSPVKTWLARSLVISISVMVILFVTLFSLSYLGIA